MGGAAVSAEIIIPPLKAKQGEIIDIPVLVDKADNIAGIKLTITYDKELLIFKEGNTSKSTRSVMLVVNDKTPGRLIIVMAGAKCVSGREVTLLTLTFEVKKQSSGVRSTRIDILDAQLMSDQLKDVTVGVNVKSLDILP